jgi:hypothetical protein
MAKTAEEIARCYIEVVSRFGPAEQLVSDQGKEFINHILDSFCALTDTIRTITSGYHPQTNGVAEKANHNLINALRKMGEDKALEWDQWLPWVLLADRNRVRARTGLCPMEAVLGHVTTFWSVAEADRLRRLRQQDVNNDVEQESEQEYIISMLDRIHEIIDVVHPKLSERLKQVIQKQSPTVHTRGDIDIPPNTYVVLLKPADLIEKQNKMNRRTTQGVYKVVNKTRQGNYVLETQRGRPLVTPVHPSRLRVIGTRAAVDRLSRSNESQVLDQSDPEVFDVETVIAHKNVRGTLWYQIKWLGYDETTWEPESSLNCDELLEQYWRKSVQVNASSS